MEYEQMLLLGNFSEDELKKAFKKTFKVRIKEFLGDKNSYGYFAGEEYVVQRDTANNYRIVSPSDKKGWIIYHAHCLKVDN